MMKKTIFAALALAAAGPALAQSEQTIQNGDFTETVEYSNDKYKVETNRDHWALEHGYVAITPTQIDVTAYSLMEDLKHWNWNV